MSILFCNTASDAISCFAVGVDAARGTRGWWSPAETVGRIVRENGFCYKFAVGEGLAPPVAETIRHIVRYSGRRPRRSVETMRQIVRYSGRPGGRPLRRIRKSHRNPCKKRADITSVRVTINLKYIPFIKSFCGVLGGLFSKSPPNVPSIVPLTSPPEAKKREQHRSAVPERR